LNSSTAFQTVTPAGSAIGLLLELTTLSCGPNSASLNCAPAKVTHCCRATLTGMWGCDCQAYQ